MRRPKRAESERTHRCDIIERMPSPIGHALGGIAAGCSISRSPSRRRIAAFAIAGMLADVDFVLSITHRGPTHSLVAAAFVFAVAVSVLVVLLKARERWWNAAGLLDRAFEAAPPL